MSETILLLLFVLYIYNFAYISYKYRTSVFIIHPINIVSLYFLVFFILPYLLGEYYIAPGFLYLQSSLDLQGDFLLLILALVYIFITIANSLTKKNKKEAPPINRRKYGTTLELFIFLYIVFILSILTLLILSSEGSIFNNIAEFTIKLRNGNAFILMIIYTVELLPIIYILLSKRISKYFLFFIISTSMGIIILVGARTLILSMALSLIVLGLSYGKINIKKLSLIGLIFSIFFISGSLVRNSGEDAHALSLQEKAENLKNYFSNNSDQLFTSLYIIDSIEKRRIEYQYGSTIIDAVYFFIPTAIWPEKPRSYYPSRLVFPDIIEQGVENNTKQTINFGMIARPYLDFGITGVLFLNILTIFFLIKIFYKIIFDRHLLSNKKLVLYVYIYSHIHQIYILGIWSHVLSIILFNLVYIHIIFFLFQCFNQSLKLRYN